MNMNMKNGDRVSLPKLTLDLSDAMDAVTACDDNRKRYALQLDFLNRVIPSDILAEELGGSEVTDVDLVALAVLYVKVVNAYTAPVMEAQTKQLRDQLTTLKPIINATVDMSKVMDAGKARRGFSGQIV